MLWPLHLVERIAYQAIEYMLWPHEESCMGLDVLMNVSF